MNGGELWAALLVQASTIIGVQVAIWWPRAVKAGMAAHALRALRVAAACLMAGFALALATTGLPFEGVPVQRVLLAAMLGTMPLLPLSSAAFALEHGRRLRALIGAYGALFFAAALTWFCIFRLLFLLVFPAPRWQIACILGALVLCVGAVTAILEVYAAIRQPWSPPVAGEE